ncbi:hypothetical protein [Nocardioides korecus]
MHLTDPASTFTTLVGLLPGAWTIASAVLALGALALPVALHVGTWGAYKDSPFEGYHALRQARTLLLSLVGAAVVLLLAPPGAVAGALLPAVGVVYAVERLTTEWWKSILRVDDQSAYTIPMRLGFRGRPVEDRRVRWAVGAGVLVGMGLVAAGVSALQGLVGAAVPGWLVPLTVGGVGGWLTAVGGAWKDAPVEGFSGWKFLRSPAVATAWALPLSMFTGDWVTLAMGAGGLAVTSIETYKTFFTGGRAPGKFDGKPRRPLPPHLHDRLARAHAASWGLIALLGMTQAAVSLGAGDVLGAAAAGLVAAGSAAAARAVLHAHAELARGRHAGVDGAASSGLDPLASAPEPDACELLDAAR